MHPGELVQQPAQVGFHAVVGEVAADPEQVVGLRPGQRTQLLPGGGGQLLPRPQVSGQGEQEALGDAFLRVLGRVGSQIDVGGHRVGLPVEPVAAARVQVSPGGGQGGEVEVQVGDRDDVVVAAVVQGQPGGRFGAVEDVLGDVPAGRAPVRHGEQHGAAGQVPAVLGQDAQQHGGPEGVGDHHVVVRHVGQGGAHRRRPRRVGRVLVGQPGVDHRQAQDAPERPREPPVIVMASAPCRNRSLTAAG